jgi:hypothetical protein
MLLWNISVKLFSVKQHDRRSRRRMQYGLIAGSGIATHDSQDILTRRCATSTMGTSIMPMTASIETNLQNQLRVNLERFMRRIPLALLPLYAHSTGPEYSGPMEWILRFSEYMSVHVT